MSRNILSLKSLYQLLTVKDYPVYSTGVITRENHRGLTLTKFWLDIIQPAFRDQKYGKIIWRSDGGRNRYLSEICNRSDRLLYYGEYAKEVYMASSPANVLSQIRQFMNTLTERDYQYDVLCYKMGGYFELLAQEDDLFTKDAERFFGEAWRQRSVFEERGNAGKLFFSGWFLTFLMFHAVSGDEEVVLSGLRKKSELSLEALWQNYFDTSLTRKSRVLHLSEFGEEFVASALMPHHFFGREREMFELRQFLKQGGKYLISGMGGIGKTELVRQLLKCCERESLTDYIVVVPYEGSLMKSFVRAFPQSRGDEVESNFYEALARIRLYSEEGADLLVVIDNMDRSDDEMLAEVAALPAAVFITSRYQELPGFATYSVKTIDKVSGGLIFKDNYEEQLSAEDEEVLATILESDIWSHTLTLRFLGHAAAFNGWRLSQMYRQLTAGAGLVSMDEQDGYDSLRKLYQNLYADLGADKDKGRLLRILSVLPCQSYSGAFAERFLCGYAADEKSVERSMEELYAAGWLEKGDEGYSMHPFIAECLRVRGIREKEVEEFLQRVIDVWRERGLIFDVQAAGDLFAEWSLYEERLDRDFRKALLLVPMLLSYVKGRYSEEQFDLGMIAYSMNMVAIGTSQEGLEGLLELKRRSGELTDERRAVLYLLLSLYGYWNQEEMAAEFAAQQHNPVLRSTVKETFINRLILVNYNMNGNGLERELVAYFDARAAEGDPGVNGCILYALNAIRKGDIQTMGEWLEKGIELFEKGEKSEMLMSVLMLTTVPFYLSVQQFDKAEAILKKYEALDTDNTLESRLAKNTYWGSLFSQRGDEGYGIPQLEEACRIAKVLWRQSSGNSYAVALSDLAIAYNKAGRREKALECYRELTEMYGDDPNVEFQRHRVFNNMGVVYLDLQEPRAALECLEKSYELAERLGGLGLGETCNNLSKAWRMLGDRAKEQRYLERALPILEQFYGDEHPKVTDARRRLKGEEAE